MEKEMIKEAEKNSGSNFLSYMSRMDYSFRHSSKGFIPMLVKGQRILDVGCGTGVLMESLEKMFPSFDIEGVDLNDTMIEECRSRGLKAECRSFYDVDVSYGTVIFSSVLHEFSSYAKEEERYSKEPIRKALLKTYEILRNDGNVIIRDGIKEDYGKRAFLHARSDKQVAAVTKYLEDNPVYKDVGLTIDGLTISADRQFLKEFLYTYTWGEESYSREVNELFGILTVDEWIALVKECGFKIANVMTSAEEYEQYLEASFDFSEDDADLLQNSTILLNAIKK